MHFSGTVLIAPLFLLQALAQEQCADPSDELCACAISNSDKINFQLSVESATDTGGTIANVNGSVIDILDQASCAISAAPSQTSLSWSWAATELSQCTGLTQFEISWGADDGSTDDESTADEADATTGMVTWAYSAVPGTGTPVANTIPITLPPSAQDSNNPAVNVWTGCVEQSSSSGTPLPSSSLPGSSSSAPATAITARFR